jgi:hypothetical protein
VRHEGALAARPPIGYTLKLEEFAEYWDAFTDAWLPAGATRATTSAYLP